MRIMGLVASHCLDRAEEALTRPRDGIFQCTMPRLAIPIWDIVRINTDAPWALYALHGSF
jgi:hypothetical protein